MPILPAEPDLFPENLWEREVDERRLGKRWWCLHTLPRQEKTAARQLRSLRLAYFLPQAVQESRTPGGRKLRSLIPLFPSYLFLLGDEYERVEALKGNHLAKILEVADQERLVRDLEQIQRMLATGLPVVSEPSFPVGAWVRIKTGPLRNLEGVVCRRQGQRDRFAAVVEFLGQSATVELEDWQVEPVPDESLKAGIVGKRAVVETSERRGLVLGA